MNYNVALKRIETKKDSKGLTSTTQETSNLVVMQVAYAEDPELVGENVLVSKYDGEWWNGLLIVPLAALKFKV